MSDMPASNALSDLTERGKKIIELLVRFGIMTIAALRGWYQELSADAARKVLERLSSDGWCNKYILPSGEPYFVLSNAACNRLELKRTGAALRQRALIRRCLVLYYFAERPHLVLLTASECKESLPTIYRRGAANFYFVNKEDTSLGWICLDDGKAPARVRTKTAQLGAKRS